MEIAKYHAGKYKDGAIKLSSNECHFGLPSKVRETIQVHIDDIPTYPDMQQVQLKNALATYLNVDTEQLVIGHGSDEILCFIAMRLLERNDITFSARETFSVYKIASQIMHANHHTIPLSNGCFDLKTMQERIRALSAKIVFICNPNNPTGTYISHRRMFEFITQIPHDVFVVLDEAYFDFVSGTAEHIPLQEKLSWHPNLIVLRTFSKLFSLAGMRVGYCVASKTLAQVIDSVRMPFNINILAQKAAIAALESQSFYIQIRDNIISERNRMREKIISLGYTPYPSETNFICFPVDGSNTPHISTLGDLGDGQVAPADVCFDFFVKHNVMIRSLNSFNMNNAVRITIGTPEENNKVLDILEMWKSR